MKRPPRRMVARKGEWNRQMRAAGYTRAMRRAVLTGWRQQRGGTRKNAGNTNGAARMTGTIARPR